MDSERSSGIGFIGSVVAKFLTTHLSAIFIAVSIFAGIGAVLVTPREEEPQIVVPMADVVVSCPGTSAEEVERLVTTPLERLLWQIDGVEHVYSVSRDDSAMVTVRFYVGEDRERSYVKIQSKLDSNRDIVPHVVRSWIVRPIEIDDVAVVTFTITSRTVDAHGLTRIAEELKARLDGIEDISRSEIVGSLSREITVSLDPERLKGKNLTVGEVAGAIQAAGVTLTVGSLTNRGSELAVKAGSPLSSVEALEKVPVSSFMGGTVYLSDIAVITDGPPEPVSYVWHGSGQAKGAFGSQSAGPAPGEGQWPAVTMAFSKKKGTNAVKVATEVIERMEALRKEVVPDGVEVVVTRNYGQTADAKVNELLMSLVFAMVTVVALIAFAMGWREAFVVAMAVPISFALALSVNYLAGFTINRVTLFALILSLGMVVDDPITNVDNIQRHILRRRKNPMDSTLDAVNEVLPPVIMSTLTIIVSFVPMFFITGMMGPYMRPMAINVPLTVTFSTLCALSFVPWLAWKLLRHMGAEEAATADGAAAAGKPDGQSKGEPISGKGKGSPPDADTGTDVTPDWVRKTYRRILSPLLNSRAKTASFFVLVGALLLFAGWLAITRRVPLKMLPFDNKNEFLISVDMPEGTAAEETARVLSELSVMIRSIPEVTDYTCYSGVPSPTDFNGLVRHYYMRRAPHFGEIRVNLADKSRRSRQSHEIVTSLRDQVAKIAADHGGIAKMVETPPGPPVISTITAEIYGRDDLTYQALIDGARGLEKVLSTEEGVVEIDDMAEAERDETTFQLDRSMAATHGISQAQAAGALAAAFGNGGSSALRIDGERNPLLIRTEISRDLRRDFEALRDIPLRTASKTLVDLGSIGKFVTRRTNQPVYHKDLKRVVYVTAEMAGRAPAEAILDTQSKIAEKGVGDGIAVEWAGEGEWQITLRVFRDLGLAFGAALICIYFLLILETNSFFMPLVIMSAIPLTAIGIMPGFWLLNMFTGEKVGVYDNPVFFTATAMIGMIALGGIVVRNSIVLIEFIHDAIRNGMSLKEAILESGAVRLRPILLTAGTTALGALPITLDPIFSGLAWALIFGLLASTAFTLLVVPTIYNLIGKEI